MHTQTWQVVITIAEDADTTLAYADLVRRAGVSLRCEGTAHRRPGDAVVPEIGEELAVSRALSALADRLMEQAHEEVEALAPSV